MAKKTKKTKKPAAAKSKSTAAKSSAKQSNVSATTEVPLTPKALEELEAEIPSADVKTETPAVRRERLAAAAERVPHLAALSGQPLTARLYMWFGLLALLATTAYWSFLGAQIHADNADQLANTYLLQNGSVFQHALWPDQHSFLLKWPLFWLMQLFGAGGTVFVVATVAISLVTVGLFAYMIFRIERRALVFGTLCLAMASVLLVIPAQPYPGGILPVNMAMVTTRNIEYIVFIASLILLSRSRRWRSWGFVGSTICMGLLAASDKLFLVLAVVGALLATGIYTLCRQWSRVKLMLLWLASSLLAGLLAMGIVWGLQAGHITEVATTTATGPYSVNHGLKGIALGGVYLILSLFTNLGINPADDTRLLAQLPHELWSGLASVRGIGFGVNVLVALFGVVALGYILWNSGKKEIRRDPAIVADGQPGAHNKAMDVTVMLATATAAAAAAFVGSSHYYPVDARYVAIVFFTLFVALATYTRSRESLRPGLLIVAGVIVAAGICGGIGVAKNNFDQEKTAMANTHNRNERIIGALTNHKVDVLVGDYWRVLPIRLHAASQLQTMPLSACVEPRDILSSRDWQPDLSKHSFAYILSLDKSLTGYPPCSLQDIIKKYGLPNASTVIEGSLNKPRELLLFYDHGSGKNTPSISSAAQARSATVTPIALQDLPHTSCPQATIMNVVAHQDDDLLFTSPDLLHDIKAGNCIRTIYVTAGDAGEDKFYWLGREKGSEAAHTRMLGIPPSTLWLQRIIKMPAGQFVTIANPVGNPQVSLIFMHIPDGNLHGQGFASSHYESLADLERGQIPAIHAVDHESNYSAAQLTDALEALMRTYQPNEVRTQADDTSRRYPDHSDHVATGRFTDRAYQTYISQSPSQQLKPLAHYQGYPIHDRPVNVEGDDLAEKQAAFFEYAHFDGGACSSVESCSRGTVYDAYLRRQYQNSF